MFKKRKGKRPTNALVHKDDDGDEGETDLAEALVERDGGKPKHKRARADDEGDTRSTGLHTFGYELKGGGDGGATALNEYETEQSKDTRAQLEEQLSRTLEGKTSDNTGIYEGMNSYAQVIPKSMDSIRAAKHTGLHGPLRANTYVRTTARFDYQPDICKDYKETGYCGFGDTCVFLHDRGDYSKGYEEESTWDKKQRERKEKEERAMNEMASFVAGGENGSGPKDGNNDNIEEEDKDKDDLPFACHLCRGPFKSPVVTKCMHYFCESCISTSYKESKACPLCKKDLGGVWAAPRRLEAKRKRLMCDDWVAFHDRLKKS